MIPLIALLWVGAWFQAGSLYDCSALPFPPVGQGTCVQAGPAEWRGYRNDFPHAENRFGVSFHPLVPAPGIPLRTVGSAERLSGDVPGRDGIEAALTGADQ